MGRCRGRGANKTGVTNPRATEGRNGTRPVLWARGADSRDPEGCLEREIGAKRVDDAVVLEVRVTPPKRPGR